MPQAYIAEVPLQRIRSGMLALLQETAVASLLTLGSATPASLFEHFVIKLALLLTPDLDFRTK